MYGPLVFILWREVPERILILSLPFRYCNRQASSSHSSTMSSLDHHWRDPILSLELADQFDNQYLSTQEALSVVLNQYFSQYSTNS